MNKFWSKTWLRTFLSTLLLLYICLGVVIISKRSEEISATTAILPILPETEIKTIISYSLEYQTHDIIKNSFLCESKKTSDVIVHESGGNKVRLLYDRDIDSQLLSAYVDERLPPYRYIRVIAMVPHNATLFCQIWRNSNQKSWESRKATINPIWRENWDSFRSVSRIPALVSCLDPDFEQEPSQTNPRPVAMDSLPIRESVQVSLTASPCTFSSSRIAVARQKHNQTKEISFGICVKPLDFQKNILADLRDWLDINLALGVHKFTMFYSNISHGVFSFLSKLKRKGIVEPVKLQSSRLLSKNFTDAEIWFKRKLEILIYNDCLYRNLHFDFIIPLDLDEVIVPKMDRNFKQMLNSYLQITGNDLQLRNTLQKYSSFSTQNVYFFKKFHQTLSKNLVNNIKSYNTKLDNSTILVSRFHRIQRSVKISQNSESTKSLVYVPNTLSVTNHFAFDVIKPSIRQVILPNKLVQLNHYRDDCDPRLVEGCDEFLKYSIYDNCLQQIWNYTNS